MPYRTLDPDKIIGTVEKLNRRISERFPGCGLANVCAELLNIAGTSKAKALAASRPNMYLRAGIAAFLVLGIFMLVYVASLVEFHVGDENLFGILEGVDAAVNTLVLSGAGVFFLASLENRWHREKALEDLHELRSIIHVIDMHQLTKDPSRVSHVGTLTPSSPERPLSTFELVRYLDYCSEMLSLSAKIAALYAQGTRDHVVVATASDLGQITSNISGKIWQKITIAQKSLPVDMPTVKTLPMERADTTSSGATP